MAIVGGILYGRWISRRMFVETIDSLVAVTETDNEPVRRRPSFLRVVTVILLPVTLIGGALLLTLLFPGASKVVLWAQFVGHPSIALLLATAFAYVVLGMHSGLHPANLMRHTAAGLNSIGSLILIIGASGAFKQVVLDSGAGGSFVAFILNTGLSPLLMAYLVAAALRMTLGSATASIATAAGLVAPIAQAFPNLNHVLMVMAVATGGSVFSYVNDAGFWMVKEYCGMTVTQTLKSYSVMKLVTSLTGLLIILILSRFL
jgi:H+/gluconate symporter-like permease